MKKALQNNLTDELTKLKSRKKLIIDLEESEFSLLYLMNIDEFSLLNTSYGIDIVDSILITIAKRLEKIKELSECCIYRVSGDEFAVVFFKKKESIREVKNYALLIVSELSRNIKITNTKEMVICITCGIAFGSYDVLRKSQIALRVARKNNLTHVVLKESHNMIAKKNRLIRREHTNNTKALK